MDFSFKSDLNHSLPWNRDELLGYFGEIMLTLLSGEAGIFVITTLILLFISICYYHQAFYKIFKQTLKKLDRSMGDKNYKKLLLHDLIEFHVLVKE